MEKPNQIGLQVIKESMPCGYFEGRESASLITTAELMRKYSCYEIDDSVFYGFLLSNGFRRQNQLFYLEQCDKCNECTPIRVLVDEFKLSKSQKRVWEKNNDLDIKICENAGFATEEKALIFREYDRYHNSVKQDYKSMSLIEAMEQLDNMNSGYPSVINLDYYFNGSLIGVGILDIAHNNMGCPSAISSNYFYYMPDEKVLKRSLGVYSVLKEIDLCKQLRIPYYYLGLYLPNCRKMNYKINYKPYELLIDGVWQKFE